MYNFYSARVGGQWVGHDKNVNFNTGNTYFRNEEVFPCKTACRINENSDSYTLYSQSTAVRDAKCEIRLLCEIYVAGVHYAYIETGALPIVNQA